MAAVKIKSKSGDEGETFEMLNIVEIVSAAGRFRLQLCTTELGKGSCLYNQCELFQAAWK